ncbi:septin 3/9/12 [Enteropsectra breve]|nr:septin 3/9/12 [Enteropsectra breve]
MITSKPTTDVLIYLVTTNKQMLRKRNIQFTIMTAGPRGSGKTSLINNIIKRSVISNKGSREIDVYLLNIEGGEQSQKMAFIETPGFGQTLDDEAVQNSIMEYIKDQFDSYIEEESKIRRNAKYEDKRVHCLLYTIPATTGMLKQRDIAFLQKLSDLVNIIPVITKADALTIEERWVLKLKINEQLAYYKIRVFNFENEEYFVPSAAGTGLNGSLPFTAVCSNNSEDENPSRNHEAGHIEIESRHICDISLMREALLASHIDVLVETTSTEIYEKYRAEVLENALKQ